MEEGKEVTKKAVTEEKAVAVAQARPAAAAKAEAAATAQAGTEETVKEEAEAAAKAQVGMEAVVPGKVAAGVEAVAVAENIGGATAAKRVPTGAGGGGGGGGSGAEGGTPKPSSYQPYCRCLSGCWAVGTVLWHNEPYCSHCIGFVGGCSGCGAFDDYCCWPGYGPFELAKFATESCNDPFPTFSCKNGSVIVSGCSHTSSLPCAFSLERHNRPGQISTSIMCHPCGEVDNRHASPQPTKQGKDGVRGGQERGKAAESSQEDRWCQAEDDDLRELPIEEVSDEDDDM